MSIKFFWRKLSGNPAGHESADTSNSKHTAHIEQQLQGISTAIFLATQVHANDRTQLKRIAKEASLKLREIAASINEERQCSGETPNGSAEKVARQEKVGGLQLCFELYCWSCAFQCWECPLCGLFRCKCTSCGCDLDNKIGKLIG